VNEKSAATGVTKQKNTKCKEKIFLYEFDHSEGSIRKNVSGDFQKIVSIPKLTE